jgi:NADP-dependent 3-hydroxy acid dehydrogenase YdfG
MSTSVFRSDLLLGKAALITGGGSGIGAGIAKRLAAQGAKVALLGRTQEKLSKIADEITAAGGTAKTFATDVRDYAAVDAAVKGTVEAFGRLDIVVNSAAGNFLSPAASRMDSALSSTSTCAARSTRVARRSSTWRSRAGRS